MPSLRSGRGFDSHLAKWLNFKNFHFSFLVDLTRRLVPPLTRVISKTGQRVGNGDLKISFLLSIHMLTILYNYMLYKRSRVFETKTIFNNIKKKQLHAISRTQQVRQRVPSVKTLRSPLSAEFWRHCVLSGRPQRYALSHHQSEEMKI